MSVPVKRRPSLACLINGAMGVAPNDPLCARTLRSIVMSLSSCRAVRTTTSAADPAVPPARDADWFRIEPATDDIYKGLTEQPECEQQRLPTVLLWMAVGARKR